MQNLGGSQAVSHMDTYGNSNCKGFTPIVLIDLLVREAIVNRRSLYMKIIQRGKTNH